MRDISKLAVVAFCLAAATAFGALVGSSGSGSSAPATTLERIDTTRFRILSSDATGLTADLLSPSPTVEQLNDPAGNVRVHLDKAEPSGEVGAPELPVYRMMIGVPDGAQIVARATIASSRDLGSHRVVPNPDAKVVYEPNGIQRAEPIFHADPTYYRQTAFYPADIAAVTGTAMIRHRRVAQVEVRPVQYQPSSGRLRAFAKVTVRVDFVGGNAAPSRSFGSKTRESAAFTEFFARELVNDNVSSAWQAAPSATMSAPSQQPEAHTVAALKLYINKKGVYRIDGRAVRDYLVDAGVTLDQINPQHLRVTFEGKELPIYVSGEKDRRFDETDYVEFLAARPTTVYSQFSVYRLEIGLRPGLRVAEAEGAPRDSLSTLVPTFRSKLYFEENKNFLLLQHVPPEEISPDDPHGWYEARDHWFWFGVQNGIDKAEAEYQFPLYDTAQSFDLARIDLNMVGGSPVVHDFQVSFNGVKVARRTLNRQDEATVGRSLAPSDLIDAAKGMNTIRLSRLDTNDEPNTDQYHYHFYVNSFSMEYTRLFKAVGDELFFATPPFPNTTLEVRRRRTLEYSIGEFVGDDVAVYEHDDTGFTTRFRNPEISRVPLTPQTRDRLHAIQTSLGERISTPAALYTTRIQMPDTRDAKYVAVSSRGVKTPYRIEYDRPSDLKSPNNAADWIVIYHPRFAEAAQRLADWRRDPQGGGFRAEAVDVFDIYDEFGHGMQSDKAIKAFLTHAFVNWQAPAISHVVILGDGTTDFFQADKVLYPEPPEFMGNIPTHYVWTLYGQSASDHWYSTISGIDPIPDLFVGRLPVETEDQARAVVEKIIAYDRAPPNGSWRRQIISVADDDTTNSGDFIFKQSLNEISQNHTLLGYQTNRIFLEDIIEDVSANPDDYRGRKPAAIARERIVDSLSRGAVIAQYAGHGGRLVWAHEIIFDNPGIRTLQPSDGRFPLMFVLSCNNGFFDAPADPAMSEVLLRLPETGIIGMIAATRLTFGSGNDALNRIIFDDIFQRKVRSFGEIAFNTKTRLMVDQGLSHLEVMQQYSLFGDPASNLQIADLEFRPEVVNRSVEPGGTLRIAGGSVLHSEYIRAEDRKEFTPVTDFTGTVFVTAQFIHRTTGAVIAQLAEAPITNGRYNEISLDVPATARSGRAQVELFAQTRESLAVGGSTFAVSEPVVEDLDVRVVGSNLAVSAQVTDDLQIASVELEWYDGSQQTWQVSPLVRDTSRGAGWYSLQATIPEPEIGESFEYLIRVIDGDGNKVETTTFRLTPNPLPDWRIQVGEQDRRPLIDYAYDPTDGWRVVVQVENTNRDAKTDIPLKLNLYLGNPDLDRNDEPDADAELLGAATVLPSDWTRGDPLGENPDPSSRLRRSDTPLSTTWSAKAVIPLTLEPGRYLLYAWIDPSTVATRDETRETRFTNNLSTGRLIHIAQTLVPNNGGSLRSLDNGLRIDLPNGALPTARVVEVTTLGALPTGQASVTALPALGSSGAYQVSAGEETFGSPAAVELRFDLTTFRRALQIEAGMGDSPYDALSNEQKAILQELARGELASAGLYQW
ncbi:MAG: C25 family cysteine peptidase, partial [Candidatus Poribacteria bacterium]|nr:C25 family cysteine peptidase [Candidatus Poribacteria bacterium]